MFLLCANYVLLFESETLNYQISYFSLYDKSMFVVREIRFCEQQSKVLNVCLSSGVNV